MQAPIFYFKLLIQTSLYSSSLGTILLLLEEFKNWTGFSISFKATDVS